MRIPSFLALAAASLLAVCANTQAAVAKSGSAVRLKLECYTRFQSSAWSTNIFGVYALNNAAKALPTGTRITWTVHMARNCTDKEAQRSLDAGEFTLKEALPAGEAVKLAEATAGSAGGHSYTIAGCDAEVMR
jgi:hypothetical protein